MLNLFQVLCLFFLVWSQPLQIFQQISELLGQCGLVLPGFAQGVLCARLDLGNHRVPVLKVVLETLDHSHLQTLPVVLMLGAEIIAAAQFKVPPQIRHLPLHLLHLPGSSEENHVDQFLLPYLTRSISTV